MQPAELEIAIAAVRSAVVVCREVQATLVSAETLEKRDRSPVTVADFASQALICAALGERSSVSAIVGEETSQALREAESAALLGRVVTAVAAARPSATERDVLDWIDRGGHRAAGAGAPFWTLDPIDGTKGFLRNEHYAVALALIEDGEPVLGVLGCPGLGALFTAVRGRGARALPLAGDELGGEPIRVRAGASAAGARFCESVESGHSDQGRSARIAARLGITAEPVRMDSQAKYAAVARGDAAIYLRMPTSASYREKIWDHAAGALIITEAGGRVTDVTGAPLDFSAGHQLEHNRGVVATNGGLHDAVLAAVAAEA